MDAHAVQLAMAALFGASIVAVSAYYMHRKRLTRLLEFARTVELEGGSDGGDSPRRRRGGSKRRGNGSYRRGSGSLPDVTALSDRVDGNGLLHVEGIPAGLPRLQTLPEGIVLS
jgi:AMP deaminase